MTHTRHKPPNRSPRGAGVLREQRAGGRLWLESIGCELTVDEIYLKVFGG